MKKVVVCVSFLLVVIVSLSLWSGYCNRALGLGSSTPEVVSKNIKKEAKTAGYVVGKLEVEDSGGEISSSLILSKKQRCTIWVKNDDYLIWLCWTHSDGKAPEGLLYHVFPYPETQILNMNTKIESWLSYGPIREMSILSDLLARYAT